MGYVTATWESMKTAFLLGNIPDNHRMIAIGKSRRPAIAGVESALPLLKVPVSDALTLQIEQVGIANELS